jgi:hypothetical protein
MGIVEQSFKLLYEAELEKSAFVKYSGKFKPYNANVRITPDRLVFNLSREWKQVDEQIKIGLIQSLLMKIYKKGKNTGNVELYSLFIKNLGSFVPKIYSDPVLEDSFNRVNEKYFFNVVEKTNLKWGSETFSKLGSYSYQTDAITISSIFRSNAYLLDYVMYHEMLHKKHSFKSKKGRSYYHTFQFRNDEKKFENSETIEKELKKFISSKRLKKAFRFF